MTSRLIPPALTREVRSALEAELERTDSVKRPRGRAGIHHDRTRGYLGLMLERSGHEPDASRTTQAGDLVSVRFAGDAEHRTYLLQGDETPAATGDASAPTVLTLPASWPLGQALLGLAAGATTTYHPGGGDDVTVTVIAIWDTSGAADLLPESDPYA